MYIHVSKKHKAVFILFCSFISAVKENLRKSGKLNKVKAELRAEIAKLLEPASTSNKPEIPSDILIINELIREFLIWNGYHYTNSVLVAGKKKYPYYNVFSRRF
jgi:lisH domain-containing protein FOPNL